MKKDDEGNFIMPLCARTGCKNDASLHGRAGAFLCYEHWKDCEDWYVSMGM